MGIFDLPPKEKRKYSHSFLQYGNIEKEEWIKEPDYYIVYCVGRDLRYVSIFAGLIALLICYLYRHEGWFPSAMDYIAGKKLIDLYLYLINFSVLPYLVILVWYGLLFYKSIDFSEYNLLRQVDEKWKKLAWQRRKFLPVYVLLFAPCILMPSSLSYLYDMPLTRRALSGYQDDMYSVFAASIFFAGMHSGVAQLGFKFLVLYFYALYIDRNNKSGRDE